MESLTLTFTKLGKKPSAPFRLDARQESPVELPKGATPVTVMNILRTLGFRPGSYQESDNGTQATITYLK